MNPLSELPRNLLEASVAGQLSRSALGRVIQQYFPRFQVFLIELLQDPHAVGKFLEILLKTEDLKTVTKWVAGLLVVFYFLRRSLLFTIHHPLKRRLAGIAMTLSFSAGVSLTYYWQVADELAPALSIFARTCL